ncbi:hypothetical protein [Aliiglaciecola lipolytica]|uniref:Uncharacterized protein n=1 Tax=Aliiglaciecola lipolytica E3 TaxID=1127673 RepID=K6YD70_9ALTE|nr:hypothetical protein [Aliiglaciecola lipolytica]GAC16147.1 hypothetical protein GLIP_3535 [Aliiglaciecola lipolytica E3]
MILAIALFAGGSFAEQQTQDKEVQEDLEKVEVVGTTPLYYYRQQMVKTELDFYDAFNELVEDPKFKVKCKRERVNGAARITQRACYPQYFLAKKSQLTEIAMRANGILPSNEEIEMMVQPEKAESLAYAEKLIEENPQLKKRLMEMYQAKQTFLSKKELRNHSE